MDNRKAKSFFRIAMDYMADNYSDELEWAREVSPKTLMNMTSKQFLWHYCWVVYVSGFRESIISDKFNDIKKAFKNFDIEKISMMNSVEPVLQVFNNQRKAMSFLKGSKLICREGFLKFKEKVQKEGMKVLRELPGIGEITQKHLARNIGLSDVAKDDVLLRRLMKYLGASDEKELAEYLSGEFGEKKGVVDAVLWRFCSKKGWRKYGYDSLGDFIPSL